VAVIKVVTFDADGTLWDFQRVMREALVLALDALRSHAPRQAGQLTIADLMRIREQVAAEAGMRGATHEQIRLVSFERTLEEIGTPDPDLARRVYKRYMQHRFESIQLFDDVLPTLDALGALGAYSLGIVSNGNSYPDRCGLPDRFRFSVFADEHGSRKPDRRLFEAAVRLAGCRPDQILHVGDSLLEDVAGAQAAGLRAVWINRERQPNTTAIVPDFELHALSDLPALFSIEAGARGDR
jgi:putative hydrolase of the HAD superfamily